ncbi:unnamed protein product, partial [Closterium sp. NIES-53]
GILILKTPPRFHSLSPACSPPSIHAALIVSIPLAVAAVGAPLGGWLADVAGRRRAFQIASLPFIAGSLLSVQTPFPTPLQSSAAASTTWHMVIGRALVGVGLGIVSGAVPLYISEREASPAGTSVTLNLIRSPLLCAAAPCLVFSHRSPPQVTPTSSRGTWGTLAQLSTSTGVFSALLAGLPLEQHHSW